MVLKLKIQVGLMEKVTQMTGPTHLPNEILSLIIDQLASEDGDPQTLRACRLVSYTLCSLATPLCFSSMHLDTGKVTAKTAMKWNQLLSNNDIAGSVRTLDIRSYYTDELQDSTIGSIIAKILHRLPHIQHLTLRPLRHFYFKTIWEDLGLAIRALFRSPSLENVDLYYFLDFPLTLITTCPNLRNLSTKYLSFSDNEVDDASNLQGSYLEELYLPAVTWNSLGACVRNHRSFAEKFSRLNKITIDNGDNNHPSLTYDLDILLLASQSLTTIVIHTTCDGEDSQLAGGRYHLSQFPNLQHLEIRFRVQVEDNKNLFLFLNQLLSISSPTSLLETLIVDICWECQLEDILALFLPNIGWSALDETLTSNKFISLRQVSFYLDVYILTSGHSMEFEVLRRLARPDINALFPRLRNTVEVDIQSGI